MSGEDNFIEDDPMLDPFDPKVIEAIADRNVNDVEDADAKIKDYLVRRQNAYKRLFAKADPNDLKIVMQDIMAFSRVMQPTWNADQKRQDLLEGRRELALRIIAHTRLDFNTLFLMFTDAQTKLEK